MKERNLRHLFYVTALLFAALPAAMTNAQAASVWINPLIQSAAPGDSVSVDVFLLHDQPIGAGSFDVSYDDTRLHYTGFTPDTSLIVDPVATTPPPAVTEDPADGLPGRVAPVNLTPATLDGFNGGPLGSLGFDVLPGAANGAATLSVEESLGGFPFFTMADLLANNFSSPVVFDFTGAAGAIVVTPIPAAGWLMLSALVTFVLISYRRSLKRNETLPGAAGYSQA